MATPPIKWAQRKDSIFIEIAVADIEKDAKIVLSEVCNPDVLLQALCPQLPDASQSPEQSKLEFFGKSHGKEYKADLEFFELVDPQDAGR